MAKRIYNDIIYSFDIETTTVNETVVIYLSNFMSVNFYQFKNSDDTIKKAISKPVFCRTSEEINNFLINLNKDSGEKTTIVFIHNLAYEFDYLIKNVPFVYKNFNNKQSLFVKPRIPLFIRLGHIELRCSYKLLNKSLGLLGQLYDFPKLRIDYDKKYYPFSTLPPKEYDYNAQDTRLTLFAILKECQQWPFIKTVADIPYTSTGFTRKNNKEINSKRIYNICANYCNYQKEFSKDFIEFLENCFCGGYNHSNAYYTFLPIEKPVLSLDIISSYPDSMLHRDFPHFFQEYTGKHKLAFFKHLINVNDTDYLLCIKNYRRPFKYSFLVEVELENITPKILRGDNLILPISFNKCTDVGLNSRDNGRIYKAKKLTICCTEIDFFCYTMFYDFKVKNVKRLYYTKYHTPLPEYIRNSVTTYLTEKSDLKQKLKIQEDDFLSKMYLKSKEKLNAQYGINVQKLLPLNIKYNVDDDNFITERKNIIEDKVLTRDFISGIYICSYSRLNLFCFGQYLCNHAKNEVHLLYSDTDSYKVLGDNADIKQVVNDYNNMVEKIVHNSKNHNIGLFDLDGEYEAFCTCGCKKYIYLKNNKIYVTIAGINKRVFSESLTNLYNNLGDDFDFLCKIAFSPDTLLDYSVTEKMVSKYHNDFFEKEVIDENGKAGIIKGNNMVEICDTGYILNDCEKAAIYDYVNHCETLQNRSIAKTPTFIYKKDGIVKWSFISDWKKTVKIYKIQNMNTFDYLF